MKSRLQPLNRHDYPKTRFWTEDMYTEWSKTPAFQWTHENRAACPFPYLEDTDGKLVTKGECRTSSKRCEMSGTHCSTTTVHLIHGVVQGPRYWMTLQMRWRGVTRFLPFAAMDGRSRLSLLNAIPHGHQRTSRRGRSLQMPL